MHIPDGYLTDPVCALTTVAAGAAVAASVAAVRRSASVPGGAATMAATAGIMTVQMANFPVGHGTSGHLLGAVAAAVVLGPWPALLAMTGVLAVQAVLFGDGGAMALGANVLNMAVLPCLAAAIVRKRTAQPTSSIGSRMALAGLIGALSVLAAAGACSLELALSGAAEFSTVLSAMLVAHLPMALAEGLATAGVAGANGKWAIFNRQRRIAEGSAAPRFAVVFPPAARFARGSSAAWIFLAATTVAGVVSLLASGLPDGLTSVAATLGLGEGTTLMAPLAPDYALTGIAHPLVATVLAAMLAVVAASSCGWVLAQASAARRR